MANENLSKISNVGMPQNSPPAFLLSHRVLFKIAFHKEQYFFPYVYEMPAPSQIIRYEYLLHI